VERKPGGLGTVGRSELRAEGDEVEEARAAPGIDALVRIADGRHRETLSEDAVDQVRLGHVRVLVLVEDNGGEAFAVLPDDLREAFHDLEGERDLIAEVDDRSEEHTSELQSRGHLVCRLLLEKKKK